MNGQGLRIGLTGGIGAGKSLVASFLKKRGLFVLDADETSRKVVEPGQGGYYALIDRYGGGILQEDGALNRKALADIIFAKKAERIAVNALLHPPTLQWMREQENAYIKENPGAPTIWDVPLLIEEGLYTFMDKVVLIVADDELRIARLMVRDHCTREAAIARINSQMPQNQKIKYADAVIHNNSTQQALFELVTNLFDRLIG